MTSSSTTQLAPGTFVDHFRVGRQLGKGGMGTVYLGEDTNLGRPVALKVLSPALLEIEGYLERFRREAKSAAKLNHPNVVGIFHLGIVGKMPYFAMEYVEGTPLDEVVAKGPLEPKRAVALVLQVLDGLSHADSHGVIHRDLKPANLVLGADDRVRILDFGLARADDATNLTQSGAIMGTPDFMAPEQGLGKRVERTADIYAVGVILFQFLTGTLPFRGTSTLEVMMAHVQEPPPDLRQVFPELPDEVAAVVARCLEKDPGDRFQDYATFTAALRAVASLVHDLPAFRRSSSSEAAAETVVGSSQPDSLSKGGATKSPGELGAQDLGPMPLEGNPNFPYGPLFQDAYLSPREHRRIEISRALRHLWAFYRHPYLAREDLLRQVPGAKWDMVKRMYFSLAVPGIFCLFLHEGPMAFVGYFFWIPVFLSVLGAMTWAVSKALGCGYSYLTSVWLTFFTLSPLLFAGLEAFFPPWSLVVLGLLLTQFGGQALLMWRKPNLLSPSGKSPPGA